MSADYVTHDEFELKFSKLDAKMDARFQQIDARFQQVDSRFQQMDARFQHLENTLKNEVKNINRHFAYFATKAEMAGMETRLIKWLIGTVLTSTGLAATIAFGLAKFIQ